MAAALKGIGAILFTLRFELTGQFTNSGGLTYSVHSTTNMMPGSAEAGS